METFRTTVATLVSLAALALWAAPAPAQSTLLDADRSDGTDVLTLFDDAGFVVLGEQGTGSIPASGAGTRMMWHPAKAAFRAGEVAGSQWDDANVGGHSVAFGLDTEASGFNSTAMGGRTIASATASTAMGLGTTASAATSTAMGELTSASGQSSTAMGAFTTASGQSSTAMGDEASASGDFSTAMGGSTIASANASTAMGFGTIASGNSSTAMGGNTTASGDNSTAMGNFASTNGNNGTFVYGDASTFTVLQASTANQFAVRAQHFWLGRDANNVTNPSGEFLTTSTGAYLSDGGAWTDASSRAGKENLRAVDPGAVLETVAELPVQRWNYRAASPEVEHLGPMAEDFHAAFELGADAHHIAPLDVGGVSLVAIQALQERTREQAEMIETLRSQLAEQRSENQELRDRMRRLEAIVEEAVESEGQDGAHR